MAGVPPQGGGAYDAINHAYDIEEYDSAASADTVEKTVSDAGAGVIEDLLRKHVFQRVVLDGVTQIGATKFPRSPALVIDPSTLNMFAVWQAGSAATPSGIVASWSTDGGETWTAPAQVADKDEPFYPSIVIDPSSGDIHMVLGKAGVPAGDSTDHIFYQVLPRSGSNWTLSGNLFQIRSGTTVGYSNPSLAVDDNGFLTVSFMELETDNDVWIDTMVSNAPWDLTASTFDDEFQITDSVEARIKLIWGTDDTASYWLMMIEQNGTYRLYKSLSILSGSQHALTWEASKTYFSTSTDEFDMVWLAAPLNGACGIVQKEGNAVEFRTWSPDDVGSLSDPQDIDGDAPNPCRYPAIMEDALEFIVVYAREVDTDDHQIIYQRSNNTGADWNVDRHPLDEDNAGNHWGWLKFPATTIYWDRLAVIWCDNANTPYDVHFGMAAIPVARAANDAGAGADTLASLILPVDDVGAIAEEVVGGENKGPVSDVGAAVESLSQERPLSDVGVADEAVLLDPIQLDEAVEGEETFPDGVDLVPASAESASVAETGDVSPTLTPEAASAAETLPLPERTLAVVVDVGEIDETFPLQDRAIFETAQAIETFLEAEPNLMASIHDDLAGHTSTLLRLDSAQWTEASEQAGQNHKYQKLFQFKDALGMGATLFRRRNTGGGDVDGPWSDLERSVDAGVTWTGVLSNCADVSFGTGGVGYAIATGGDARAHKIYKSTDQGANWSLVYTDDPGGVVGEEPPFSRIAVDPADDTRVMVMGNTFGTNIHSQIDLRLLFTSDSFDTAPTARTDPIVGFFLFGHPRLLLGANSGRWVITGRPDFITDSRFRVWTSDDDGVTWDQRLDQAWRIHNRAADDMIYEGSGKLFLVLQSSINPIYKSTDNGSSWSPINISSIAHPETGGPAITVFPSLGINALAVAYDRDSDRLFIGTDDTNYPVIAAVDVRNGITWENLRANMVTVTGPGSLPATSLSCSYEGLAQLASLGLVTVAMSDVVSVAEVLDTLNSVEESAVAVEDLQPNFGIPETAAADETFDIAVTLAEVGVGTETLTLVLLITDAAAAAEVFARTDEIWLAVRLLLHEGIANLRLEGPAGSAVPGR